MKIQLLKRNCQERQPALTIALTLIFFLLLMPGAGAQTGVQPAGAGTKNEPYLISTSENLLWVTQNTSSWNQYFLQTYDIDASGISEPIGNSTTKFTGGYNGLGHSITGLNLSISANQVGLFGNTNGGEIKNLNVTGASVSGGAEVGVLIGRAENGTVVSNVYVSGEVISSATGAADAGGLVGYAVDIAVSNSGANVTVNAAGRNVGGFVGDARKGTFDNCYALGAVTSTGRGQVGGFAGFFRANHVKNSWARGDAAQGGTADQGVGGFIGLLNNSQSHNPLVENNFSTGAATGGNSNIGGFIGNLSDSGITLNNNFFNTTTSGTETAIGSGTASGTNPVTGRTTVQMQDKTTFTTGGWSFNADWFIDESQNAGFPISQWAAEPSGSITIISATSDPQDKWSLNNGTLKSLDGDVSIAVADFIGSLTAPTTLFDADNLTIVAPGDIIIDANLQAELNTTQTIYMKAGGDIRVNNSRQISATIHPLNLVFWSDTDAYNGGMVWLREASNINTNGGHLWMGGGSGSTSWNGLTVGDGYAVSSSDDLQEAIRMDNVIINTGAGHQLYRGNQINKNGSQVSLYIGGGSTIYSTTGDISFDGLSNSRHAIRFQGASIGWNRVTGSTGIITAGNISFQAYQMGDNNNNAYPAIDSRDTGERNNYIVSTGGISFSGKNNGDHFIRLYGDDRIGWNGTDTEDAYVAANISITSEYGGTLLQHLPTNYTDKKTRIHTKSTGTFSFTNELAGSFTLSHPEGFIKAGNIEINSFADVNFGNWTANSDISITAGGIIRGDHDHDASSNTLRSNNNGTITIKTNEITFSSENRIESGGELHVKAFTDEATIGIAGATGTLQLPATYFEDNFEAGFSQITIGSPAQTGNININNIEFRDNMRLQTSGTVVVNGNQTITLPNGVRLQVDNDLQLGTDAKIEVQTE